MRLLGRQKKMLRFIRNYIVHSKRAPSIREISGKLKISPRTALRDLNELESAGYISRFPFSHRNINVIVGPDSKPSESVRVPIIGQVAAGSPILAKQNIEDFVEVPVKLIKDNKNMFLLKVKGDSMKPYLENGDLAIVRESNTAQDGDFVIASIEPEQTGEYEATIKKFYKRGRKIVLQPLNQEEFDPQVIDSAKCHIQGIVKGVIKYLS